MIGIKKAKKFREYIDILETEEVFAVISLGYRDIEPEMPKRKDTDAILKFF